MSRRINSRFNDGYLAMGGVVPTFAVEPQTETVEREEPAINGLLRGLLSNPSMIPAQALAALAAQQKDISGTANSKKRKTSEEGLGLLPPLEAQTLLQVASALWNMNNGNIVENNTNNFTIGSLPPDSPTFSASVPNSPPSSPPSPSQQWGNNFTAFFPPSPNCNPAVIHVSDSPTREDLDKSSFYGSLASLSVNNNNSVYSSALHQLVLLQHWVPILEKLSPANKAVIWETCRLIPTFKNYNKNSFRKTINAWATNILPNMSSITVLFGAIGFLKHHAILKNEFCFPNSNTPVFRTFITNPIPSSKPPKHDGSVLHPTVARPADPDGEPAHKRSRKMDLASIMNS